MTFNAQIHGTNIFSEFYLPWLVFILFFNFGFSEVFLSKNCEITLRKLLAQNDFGSRANLEHGGCTFAKGPFESMMNELV